MMRNPQRSAERWAGDGWGVAWARLPTLCMRNRYVIARDFDPESASQRPSPCFQILVGRPRAPRSEAAFDAQQARREQEDELYSRKSGKTVQKTISFIILHALCVHPETSARFLKLPHEGTVRRCQVSAYFPGMPKASHFPGMPKASHFPGMPKASQLTVAWPVRFRPVGAESAMGMCSISIADWAKSSPPRQGLV